jgi:plasmid stability protein
VPSIQVKNVPQDVHRTLRRRAAASGKSLQEYLRAELIEQARKPTMEELLERVSNRSGGELSFDDVLRWKREDQDEREKR